LQLDRAATWEIKRKMLNVLRQWTWLRYSNDFSCGVGAMHKLVRSVVVVALTLAASALGAAVAQPAE